MLTNSIQNSIQNTIKNSIQNPIQNQDKTLYFITESILLNYKSWIILFICLYIICPENITNSISTFILLMIVTYLLHYSSHLETSYPYNIVHQYHHDHNNLFSHYIQIVLEFVVLSLFIVLKYIKFPLMHFINEWIILFVYFFYTTVHNINYSIYHVNHVHENHHKLLFKNMGPDICDILFQTKHEPENGLENTDHYIPNIIGITFLISIMQYLWNYNNGANKDIYINVFAVLFTFSVIVLVESILFLYMTDILYPKKIPNKAPTNTCENV